MNSSTLRKQETILFSGQNDDAEQQLSLVPGLPDDVAVTCLALVDWSSLSNMVRVSKLWMSFLTSHEFKVVRRSMRHSEEFLYVLTGMSDRRRWEVLDCSGRKIGVLPTMPGPRNRAAFGVVVQGQTLLVLGGYSVDSRHFSASSDVYQFHPCLNRWTKLADMNMARYSFGCAEVNGKIYAVGGYGRDGYALSTVEVYDPRTNRWTFAQSIPRPRYSCFAFSFKNRLYVIGGRSSSIIGSAVHVDIYEPESDTWRVLSGQNRGCNALVGSCVAIGNRVFCSESNDPTRIRVFDAESATWGTVRISFAGATSASFGFGSGFGGREDFAVPLKSNRVSA